MYTIEDFSNIALLLDDERRKSQASVAPFAPPEEQALSDGYVTGLMKAIDIIFDYVQENEEKNESN